LGGTYIYAFGFQPGAESRPVGSCWHEYDPFAIRNGRCRESTYGPIQELLILVKLHDMVTRRSAAEDTSPGFPLLYVAVSWLRYLM
jgi:hypothetical protein